ncbi:cytochrome c551 [Ectobacillus ponti]|uniref:Cytochrome c n=1 Tax=Ectobacillus ponti TaxID=2961894 RepID=A0AA42BNF7_9BACI|nr:cytochrome c [Ectobacillus ponti]MCP8967617.1 cytochrome c [Ectobacillus ponti]
MNKKFLVVALGAVLTLGLGACGSSDKSTSSSSGGSGSSASTQTASAGDADKVFKQNCASCHGENLQGAVGPNLTKVGSKYTADEIKNIITNGRGAMPKGIIQGGDVDKVASWLAEKK